MIICAVCGMIPARCSCHIASPLQTLVKRQRDDEKMWGKSDDEQVEYLQHQILLLHRAIEHQRTTGAS